MKRALQKDSVKEITHNFKRFISILLIVLLGVGFFCGIKATSPDMKKTLDNYFDDRNVMDVQVMSTLGLTDKDIEELQKIEGVEKVEGSYLLDVIINSGEKEFVVKLMSLPETINNVEIIEGRLPENDKECVVENSFLLGTEHKIGDKIKIEAEDIQDDDGKDKALLKQKEVTIIGSIKSPLYVSEDRGTTKLGSGRINYYMYIPLTNFDTDIRTNAYVTVKGAKELQTYNQNYEDTIEDVKDKIEDISEERKEARYKEIYDKANKKVQDAQKELDSEKKKADKTISDAQKKINSAKSQLKTGRAELKSKKASTQKQLDQAKTQLEQAEKQIKQLELTGNVQMITAAKQELAKQKQTYETSKKKAETEFASAQAKLDKAEKEIKTNETKLQNEKKKADKEIQDAQKKIDKAKEDLKDIEKPDWYILDRNQNVGYVSYLQDSDRVANIAAVFPVVFFVVAALISLTSMTRMVEEQRVQIGTLKALGYSKIQIASKYIIYASLATVVGGLVGMSIGFYLLPRIICSMYAMMYTLPEATLEFNVQYAIIGMIVAVACTVGATIYSCAKALHGTPASLMRPKAPKSGKRVIIEKIPFIWKHLNFTQKVTARNIFRYKKRFLMTVIGVAGCTSLIIAGFGLRDAVSGMIPLQYGGIFKYNLEITLKDGLNQKEIEKAYTKITEKEEIKNSIKVNIQSVEIVKNDNNQDIQLIVPEDTENLQDFIKLRSRTNQEQSYSLNNEGVIITEKIAKLLDIQEGEIITIKDTDNVEVQAKVTAITENYLYHYIYMTPELYKELYKDLYKEEMKPNTVFAILDNLSEEQENSLGKELLKEKNSISSVLFTSMTTDIFADVMDNMTLVVWVLIIAAGLLALIVLYNLSNTNISERIRELATIKVLGFYDKEVYDYIGKETIILTIIGMLIGILGGNFLTTFIIKTCELDLMMFDPQIKIASYLYGLTITAIFATIVNIATYFALKKINMIESLKSVE